MVGREPAQQRQTQSCTTLFPPVHFIHRFKANACSTHLPLVDRDREIPRTYRPHVCEEWGNFARLWVHARVPDDLSVVNMVSHSSALNQILVSLQRHSLDPRAHCPHHFAMAHKYHSL